MEGTSRQTPSLLCNFKAFDPSPPPLQKERNEDAKDRKRRERGLRTMITTALVCLLFDVPEGFGDGHGLGETHGLRQPGRREQDLELDRHLAKLAGSFF